MPTENQRRSNMKIYATASIPKYLLYSFSLVRLEEICLENLVCLKAIRYSQNQIICKLYGNKDDIKEAIKALYQEINEECKNQIDLIKQSKKVIPEAIQQYSELLNNDAIYKEEFDKQAQNYIRNCQINDITPHPEVSEEYLIEE